jgi:hypothetical protein
VDDSTERRLAHNEALARRMNEELEALEAQSPGERSSPGWFICECSRQECTDYIVEITPSDYDRIHRHPRRFIPRPGHEDWELESIVEAHGGYVVVEKKGEAGREADADAERG